MIYGYTTDSESELLELREVTFAADPPTLRKVAAFLASMADAIESGKLAIGSHRHISEAGNEWEAAFDVIAAPPE